ncbi:MAG: hypothetical protein WA118_03460 [Carboxydocellales bacterium]
MMIARALKVGGKNVALSANATAQQLNKFSDKQQIAGPLLEFRRELQLLIAGMRSLLQGNRSDLHNKMLVLSLDEIGQLGLSFNMVSKPADHGGRTLSGTAYCSVRSLLKRHRTW